MRRLISIVLIACCLIVFASETLAVNEPVADVTSVYWIISQLLMSMGISMGMSNAQSFTFDQVRRAWEQSDIIDKLKNYASLTPAYWLFSVEYWAPKIKTWKEIKKWANENDYVYVPEKIDVSYNDVEQLKDVYNSVYGENGTETQAGYSPKLSVPTGNSQSVNKRGYSLSDAAIITNEYKHAYTVSSVTYYANVRKYFIPVSLKKSDGTILDDAVLVMVDVNYPSKNPPNFCSDTYYSAVVMYGSEAFNAHLVTSFRNSAGLEGHILNIKESQINISYSYTCSDGTVVGKSNMHPTFAMYNTSNTVVGIPLVSAAEEYNYTSGTYTYINGYALKVEEWTKDETEYINVDVTVDTRKLESAISGWGSAVEKGLIAQTETITMTISTTQEEYERLYALGITSIVDTTKAGAQSVVDSITATAAAILAPVSSIPIEKMQLSTAIATRFPFCIPFDLFNVFAGLVAARVAPKFMFNVHVRQGGSAQIEVDLEPFNVVALCIRWAFLVVFVIGLIKLTRVMIKG